MVAPTAQQSAFLKNTNFTLYLVKAIIFMDLDGKRILTKYYNHPAAAQPAQTQQQGKATSLSTGKDQKAFEKLLFEKTSIKHNLNPKAAALANSPSGDVTLIDSQYMTVYKNFSDVSIHIIAASNENELLVGSVLEVISGALAQVLRGQIEKRTVMENLDSVFLVVDETVDSGVFLESDPQVIAQRAIRKTGDVLGSGTDGGSSGGSLRNILREGLNEGSLRDAFVNVRDQFARSLLQ
ncbi:hypothetical protein MP228_000340 [Amoeboaphelidium protococcarum]|nr:hypothetical protein MP228_000340 [Amoeboaphelidium protococcarum]